MLCGNQGIDKQFLLRVKFWLSLAEGIDLAQIRLEAECAKREDFDSFGLEWWRLNSQLVSPRQTLFQSWSVSSPKMCNLLILTL